MKLFLVNSKNGDNKFCECCICCAHHLSFVHGHLFCLGGMFVQTFASCVFLCHLLFGKEQPWCIGCPNKNVFFTHISHNVCQSSTFCFGDHFNSLMLMSTKGLENFKWLHLSQPLARRGQQSYLILHFLLSDIQFTFAYRQHPGFHFWIPPQTNVRVENYSHSRVSITLRRNGSNIFLLCWQQRSIASLKLLPKQLRGNHACSLTMQVPVHAAALLIILLFTSILLASS